MRSIVNQNTQGMDKQRARPFASIFDPWPAAGISKGQIAHIAQASSVEMILILAMEANPTS
jgi:hypothetical protein